MAPQVQLCWRGSCRNRHLCPAHREAQFVTRRL